MEPFNGYYNPVTPTGPPSANPISLTDPNDLFSMQNSISNHLNKFQLQYGRYLRCQDPNTFTDVKDPPCNVDTIDSFDSLYTSYHSLLDSIRDFSNAIPAQTHLDGITPKQSEENLGKIKNEYADILALRKELDQKLQLLNESRENAENTPTKLLESAAFANTLWAILASCLIYYVVIEL